MSTTSERIKAYRKIAGMTQAQLAEKVGVNRVTITQYENGSITPPLDKIEKVASALGCSVLDLISKETFESASDSDKVKISNIAFDAANDQINRASNICDLAGYIWKWDHEKDGMIHLIDKKTKTEYAVTDEAFTAAVDGSAQFIDFNFAKLIEGAKIVEHGE